MDKKLFAETLAHYAWREPKNFLQLDALYLPNGGDDLYRPDGDGDCCTAISSVELIHGSDVRVLIPYDTDPKVAVRQLKKLAKWLKRSPDLIEYAKPFSDLGHDLDSAIPF